MRLSIQFREIDNLLTGFIALYNRVIQEKVDSKLVVSERMMRIFKITGLSEFMDIEIRRAN